MLYYHRIRVVTTIEDKLGRINQRIFNHIVPEGISANDLESIRNEYLIQYQKLGITEKKNFYALNVSVMLEKPNVICMN